MALFSLAESASSGEDPEFLFFLLNFLLCDLLIHKKSQVFVSSGPS